MSFIVFYVLFSFLERDERHGLLETLIHEANVSHTVSEKDRRVSMSIIKNALRSCEAYPGTYRMDKDCRELFIQIFNVLRPVLSLPETIPIYRFYNNDSNSPVY